MTGHTPTPWLRVGQTVYALDETGNCNRFSTRVEGGWVWRSSAQVGASGDRTPEAELNANAEFIVRACNSHDALLEALRRMLGRYVELVNCGDCGSWNPETEAEVIAARAAIARATLSTDAVENARG